MNLSPEKPIRKIFSQALLDEKALLQCMIYVDLNPISACIASDLQSSEYTSVCQRLQDLNRIIQSESIVNLMCFSTGRITNSNEKFIPYKLKDYLELIDRTGRAVIHH